MPTMFSVIELGISDLGPLDLDPIDGDADNEGRDTFVGAVFGGPGNELSQNILDAEAVDNGGNFAGEVDTDDFGNPANDVIIIDGTPLVIDSVQGFNATITYSDGTADANVTAVIFQTVDGRTFLAPETALNADTTAYEAAPIESLTIDAVAPDNPNVPNVLVADRVDTAFVCFARGSRIRTANGETPVEDLTIGDMVETLDHGMRQVRWVGSTSKQATGKFAPIRFKAGAIGNTRDLLVSPQHRMLITGWRAEVMFGVSEVLAKAKDMVNGDTIYREESAEAVEYFHILFDDHEIIFAEGAPTESLNPGKTARDGMAAETVEEILELFPELSGADGVGPDARPSLKTYEVRALMRA